MALKLGTMRQLTRCDSNVDAVKCGQALDLIEKQMPEILKIQDTNFRRARLEVFIDELVENYGLTREIIVILITNQFNIATIINGDEED